MSYSQQRTSLQISVRRAFVGGRTACHQLNILNPPWDSLSLKNISKWSIQPPSLISFIFVLVIPLSSLHTDQKIQLCILIWETRRDPTGPVHYKPRITTIPHPSSQYHPLLCVKAAFRGKIPRSICIWRSKGKPRPMGGGEQSEDCLLQAGLSWNQSLTWICVQEANYSQHWRWTPVGERRMQVGQRRSWVIIAKASTNLMESSRVGMALHSLFTLRCTWLATGCRMPPRKGIRFWLVLYWGEPPQSPEGNWATNTSGSWRNEYISLKRGDLDNTPSFYDKD